MTVEHLPLEQLLALLKDAIIKDAVLAEVCGAWRPTRIEHRDGQPNWRLPQIAEAPPAAQPELRRMVRTIGRRYALLA